jgi:1-deoxy-D-xylulose-5-phosphate synthase
VQPGLNALPFGKGEVSREGKRIAILAFGTLLYPALQAGEALNATVVNMRWAKPLDTELLAKIVATHDALVTVEEGAIMGGAGSAVLEALQDLQQLHLVARLSLLACMCRSHFLYLQIFGCKKKQKKIKSLTKKHRLWLVKSQVYFL